MKLFFVGAQGSGKGTQGKIIAKKLGLCHISTGDLLRDAEGELGKEVRNYIDKGLFVPDDLILKILEERLKQPDCEKGVILDGYPRNLAQANKLDEIMKIDHVVEIGISDDESVKRILGRAICKRCGINYNLVTQPKPKDPEVCDICNDKLIKRADDNEEALRKRLKTYHNDTEPILEHYDSIKINGEQDINDVTNEILDLLK